MTLKSNVLQKKGTVLLPRMKNKDNGDVMKKWENAWDGMHIQCKINKSSEKANMSRTEAIKHD